MVCRLEIVCVSLITSRPACTATFCPVMLPPILRTSCTACTSVAPPAPPIAPRLTMVLPTTCVAMSPTMRPLLARSPEAFRLTALPVTSAPVEFRSTVLACARYSLGTSTDWCVPSGSVTSCDTSHTMLLVSCCICASDNPIPGVRLKVLA